MNDAIILKSSHTVLQSMTTMAMFLAILHANDCITMNDIIKYDDIMVVIFLVIYLVLGIPIAYMLF